MAKSTYWDYFIDIQDISSPTRLLYLLTWFTWQKVANLKNCLSVVFLCKSKVSNFVLKLLNYYKINSVECLEKWGGTGGGSPGKQGAGGYRSREKKGREAGSLRWQEAGENFKKARFHYWLLLIIQSKKRTQQRFLTSIKRSLRLKAKFCLQKSQKTKIRTRDKKKKTALLQLKLETFPSCLHHRSWMRWNDTCASVLTVSVVSVSPLSR